MAAKNDFSKFNLIPPKTKEEIAVLEERDNTFLYSFILIFFSVFIFVMLSLVQLLIVQPRKLDTETRLNRLAAQIKTFEYVRSLNGELFVKSQLLEPILALDVKIAELLGIAERLVENIDEVEIRSYSRANDGIFVVSVEMQSFTDINKIIENAKMIPEIDNLFISKISRNLAKELVDANISFNVKL